MTTDELQEMLRFVNKLESGEVKIEGRAALIGLDKMLKEWHLSVTRIASDAALVRDAIAQARNSIPRPSKVQVVRNEP